MSSTPGNWDWGDRLSRLTDLIAATEVTDLALGQELEWAFQVERSGRDPRVAAQTLREEGPEVLGTSRGREGWLVDAGGFSAAARQLNKSVTMVSNHVQALEDRLGARLLNRTTRKISLTDIGRTYLERSRQILQDLEEADRLAEASQATPRGTLRLYSGDSIVRFLAPVMGDYLSLNPEVEVDLRTGEQMVDLLEDGFDVVIRGAPPDSSLIVRRLTPWQHFLC